MERAQRVRRTAAPVVPDVDGAKDGGSMTGGSDRGKVENGKWKVESGKSRANRPPSDVHFSGTARIQSTQEPHAKHSTSGMAPSPAVSPP